MFIISKKERYKMNKLILSLKKLGEEEAPDWLSESLLQDYQVKATLENQSM